MTKLKPCVVFDLDDTLFLTPDIDWHDPKKDCYKQLAEAAPIVSNVFLYHSIDYMVNDPPEWAQSTPNWPVDIFFLTARPENYREATLLSLSKMSMESESFLNKRLIMGEEALTTFEAKERALSTLKERGFFPVLVFDNSPDAISAYLEGGCESVHLTIASEEDREVAKTSYDPRPKEVRQLRKRAKEVQAPFLRPI